MALLGDTLPPPYSTDSRARDQWLRKVWRLEPHLAGVVNNVVLIDSNRGWEITGGRNQVNRMSRILWDADGGACWRHFIRKAALGFWTTDMGAVIELARDGRGGPLAGIYNLDSARCKLTGDIKTPLMYYPATGGQQLWDASDFARVTSLPSDDEAYAGLGFCAVSRAIEIIRLLYAVLVHDQELAAARAPRGLLLLSGISESQWKDSLKAREAVLDSLERRYYAGVQVLASSGMDNPDAKLVALSQLPSGFDAKVFTDLCMYSIALCFGYDPSEFWPVQFGALGRGRESEVQHAKATGKGGLAFTLEMQDRLQREFPDTVLFEFEERDDEGELVAASVQKARLDVVRLAYESGLTEGVPLISREEARQLLAEAGLIPEEWTAVEEDVVTTDTGERALSKAQVRRAMARWPDEPIIRWHWPSGIVETLWDPERAARTYALATTKRRQEDEVILYEDEEVKITEADVLEAIRKGGQRVDADFVKLLTAPTVEM